MLQLFDAYTQLFKSWNVEAYEEEGETYLLKLTAWRLSARPAKR